MNLNYQKKLSQDNLENILHLLGERLTLAVPDKRWNLVVCGGAALAILNLIPRTTKDIGVIGQFTEDHIEYACFDSKFSEQISIISELLNLPPDWINTGPESFIQSGLPPGLLKRLILKKYGKNLTIGFIGRYDQIFLKLYASVDRGGYHVDDLIKLKPSENELLEACKWVCEQDASKEFAALLKSMLEQIGFGDVTGKV
jgi:hypothetical protein